jgi:hypothetical protein
MLNGEAADAEYAGDSGSIRSLPEVHLAREQDFMWATTVMVAASLRCRCPPAHVILTRRFESDDLLRAIFQLMQSGRA